MNLNELKRNESKLRRRLGDDQYEKIYTAQQRIEALRGKAANNRQGAGGDTDNMFYTNRPDSGIIPNKPSIADYRRGIEDISAKIESLNKQQYEHMLSGDNSKVNALDNVIKNAEKQRDALRKQMTEAMGLGDESKEKDMLRARGNITAAEDISPLQSSSEKLIHDIEYTYNNLLKMGFDEKKDFVTTNEARDYFEALESMKDDFTPEENLKYRAVLFGGSTPYVVTDDGAMIILTAPDPSDPSSTYWDSHIRPENFSPYGKDLENAPLKPQLKDLFPTEYNDPSTGNTIDLMKGFYQTVAEDAFRRYKGCIGSNVDPYNNMLSVLAGEGLKPGDNLLVEYAKKFVNDGLPYGGDKNLSKSADCSAFVSKVYKDFGISIPGTTLLMAEDITNTKDPKYKEFTLGPGMNEDMEVIQYDGNKDEAKQEIQQFCKRLKAGDLILFNLGGRNINCLGKVDHVVMFAGEHEGKAMIVEEYSKGHNAYYRPVEDLVFNKEGSRNEDYWKERLPVYSISFLTDDERERLTVPGVYN